MPVFNVPLGTGMRLERLSVAMVEPRFGLNIGYVARTMKNFGVGHLFIVGRDDVPRSAIRFASHGADIVRGAEYVSLRELRKKFDVVVGTTAITGSRGRNPVRKTVSLDAVAALRVDPADMVIVLGRDTTGLTATELNACDIVTHMRTGTSYPTLNISHALAIMLYKLSSTESGEARRVDRVYMDRMLKYFSEMLDVSRYPKHRRRMAIKILGKAMIQSGTQQNEIIALMGVFRKVNLALERRF